MGELDIFGTAATGRLVAEVIYWLVIAGTAVCFFVEYGKDDGD